MPPEGGSDKVIINDAYDWNEDETGAITSFVKLEDFLSVVPVTVIPYFAAENGEFVTYGSNKIGDYYYDENGNDVSKNTDYQLVSENVLLNNLPARKITAPLALGKGSYFRALTAYGVESGQAYTVRYSFKNLSEQPLSFTVYQMLTGAAWSNPANRVASDPVVLQSGEDKSVSIKIRIAADNTNLLTLIRLNEDAEALNFAVSMAVENSTASRPATITLNLPEGFKVAASYKTQVNTNEKLVLPTDEQITNETGHRIIRWVDEDGNVVDGNTVLNEDITIKPELTQNATITVVMPDGLAVASDYKTDIQTGDMLVVPTSAQITGTIPNGRTLLGWYNTVSGEIIGDKYMVTETAIEIAPYFSKTEGVEKGHDFTGNDADFNGKDLVFGNEQGTGKPQNVVNGDIKVADAFLGLTSSERYTNTIVVAGGEDRYAELGRMIGYNGTYVAGGTFRYATKVAGNGPVLQNVPLTFRLRSALTSRILVPERSISQFRA